MIRRFSHQTFLSIVSAVAVLSVTTLAADPGTGVQMIITPDNGTLFVAGSARIAVQPTPAL